MSDLEIPEEIRSILKAMEGQVRELSAYAKTHGQMNLNFTLDGRLLGDIGELIVAHYYNVELYQSQKPGADGEFRSGHLEGQPVEIKCRRNSDAIDFSRIPENLIVIEIDGDDTTARVIYAGPGEPLKEFWNLKDDDFELDKKGHPKLKKKRRINLHQFNDHSFADAARISPHTADPPA